MCLGRAETETSIGAAEWLSLAPSDERFSARTRRTGNPADEVRDLDLRHVGIGLLKARATEGFRVGGVPIAPACAA
jgi:hypothetical protein